MLSSESAGGASAPSALLRTRQGFVCFWSVLLLLASMWDVLPPSMGCTFSGVLTRAGPGWCSAPGAGSAPARGVAPAAGAAASQRPVGAAALLRLPAGHAAAGVGEPGQRLLAACALGRAGGQLAPVLCPVRAQSATLHVEERRVPPLRALCPAWHRRRGGRCCRRHGRARGVPSSAGHSRRRPALVTREGRSGSGDARLPMALVTTASCPWKVSPA